MIKLKPITRNRYKCEFCNRVYFTIRGVNTHEFKCYKNPNRHCLNCNDTGVIKDSCGDYPGQYEAKYTCDACQTAKELGGKNYIDEQEIEEEKE